MEKDINQYISRDQLSSAVEPFVEYKSSKEEDRELAAKMSAESVVHKELKKSQ